MRLPIAFTYPLGGVVGRLLIGLALLAVGSAMLSLSGVAWTIAGIVFAALGSIVIVSNLRALIDSDWRKITLTRDGVEVRYGFSRRHYRFLDYSDYRVARLGLRRFLAALPLEREHALGARAQRVRVTLYDRPAFITPMPLFGAGAPASLLEWQALLNELRHDAIIAAGLADQLNRATTEPDLEGGRWATAWLAPSRLSRHSYARGRMIITIAFFVLLLAPIGIALAAESLSLAICGPSGEPACAGIEAVIQWILSLGGPILALVIFVAGNAWMIVRRAHDLGEEMPYRRAIFASVGQSGALQRRLNQEDGTPDANRFGPAPRN